MRGLLSIKEVFLSQVCLEQAYYHMSKVGELGLEGVALFVGQEKGEQFRITRTLIPRQKAYSLEEGLLYAIDSDELYRLNVFLYEQNLTLIAQIHSHPGKAYHSETDDAFPIVTTVGGLSIVVPDFATGPSSAEDFEVFRLSEDATWLHLSPIEKKQLIHII